MPAIRTLRYPLISMNISNILFVVVFFILVVLFINHWPAALFVLFIYYLFETIATEIYIDFEVQKIYEYYSVLYIKSRAHRVYSFQAFSRIKRVYETEGYRAYSRYSDGGSRTRNRLAVYLFHTRSGEYIKIGLGDREETLDYGNKFIYEYGIPYME